MTANAAPATELVPLDEVVPAPADARNLRRQQLATLLILIVGYAGFYLCRSNLSVVTPMLAKEFATRGIAESVGVKEIGTILSIATIAYGVGKFVGGMLGDIGGGRRNFVIGMGGAVLFTALFTLGGPGAMPVCTLAFMGNRFVQSFGWPGIMKIAGRSFRYQSFGLVAGVLSLSYLFGDAASRAFMGWLIDRGVTWRGVFLVDALVLASWFVVTVLFLREKPAALGDTEFPPSPGSLYANKDAEAEHPAGPAGLLRPLLTSPTFLVVCGLSMALTLLRETFNNWTPLYNVKVLHLSNGHAATASAAFSALGGVSVVISGWLSDRLGRGGRAIIIFVGLALGGLAMYDIGTADPSHVGWGVARVGLIGFLLIGPYSYLAGSVSLDFGGKRGAATACGVIDGVGYVASFLAGKKFADGVTDYGWAAAFHRLAVVAWVAAGLGLVFWVLQRKPLRQANSVC